MCPVRWTCGCISRRICRKLMSPWTAPKAAAAGLDRTKRGQLRSVEPQRQRPGTAVILDGSGDSACNISSMSGCRNTRWIPLKHSTPSPISAGRARRRQRPDSGQPRQRHPRQSSRRCSRISTWRRSLTFYGNVNGRDLGGVLKDIEPIVEARGKRYCPAAARVSCCAARWKRCTPVSSDSASGLVGAIALIYLLLVVNFQSWLDPFIIITALPGALAGVAL